MELNCFIPKNLPDMTCIHSTFHFQVVDKVAVLGNGEMICVQTSATSFGVVYCDYGSAKCATCTFGKSNCVHVNYVLSLAKQESDLSALPRKFLQGLQEPLRVPSLDAPGTSTSACLSSAPVPFNLNEAQQEVIRMPFSQRLNIVDGTSILLPDTCPPCSMCGSKAWSEEVCFERESRILTFNQLIPARG